jgi:hypothetical protein
VPPAELPDLWLAPGSGQLAFQVRGDRRTVDLFTLPYGSDVGSGGLSVKAR